MLFIFPFIFSIHIKFFAIFLDFLFFFDPIEFDNNHHDGDSADDECIFFFLSFVVVVEMDPTKDKYPHTHTHTNLNFYDTFFSRSFIRYRFIFFSLDGLFFVWIPNQILLSFLIFSQTKEFQFKNSVWIGLKNVDRRWKNSLHVDRIFETEIVFYHCTKMILVSIHFDFNNFMKKFNSE